MGGKSGLRTSSGAARHAPPVVHQRVVKFLGNFGPARAIAQVSAEFGKAFLVELENAVFLPTGSLSGHFRGNMGITIAVGPGPVVKAQKDRQNKSFAGVILEQRRFQVAV